MLKRIKNATGSSFSITFRYFRGDTRRTTVAASASAPEPDPGTASGEGGVERVRRPAHASDSLGRRAIVRVRLLSARPRCPTRARARDRATYTIVPTRDRTVRASYAHPRPLHTRCTCTDQCRLCPDQAPMCASVVDGDGCLSALFRLHRQPRAANRERAVPGCRPCRSESQRSTRGAAEPQDPGAAREVLNRR